MKSAVCTVRRIWAAKACLVLVGLVGVGCDSSGDAATQPADGSETTRPAAAESASASTQPTTRNATGASTGSRDKTALDAVYNRLAGSWKAEDVGTPAGDVTIHLRFREQGPMRLVANSDLPLVGEVRDKESQYEVKLAPAGDQYTLKADNIRGGVEVKFYFSQDDRLVIEWQPGNEQTFVRTSSQ